MFISSKHLSCNKMKTQECIDGHEYSPGESCGSCKLTWAPKSLDVLSNPRALVSRVSFRALTLAKRASSARDRLLDLRIWVIAQRAYRRASDK